MKATQLVVEHEDPNTYGGWRFLDAFDSLKAANRKFESFGLVHVRMRYGSVVMRDSAEERGL